MGAGNQASGTLRIREIRDADRPAVRALLFRNWGPPGVVTRGRLHPAHAYPGFVAVVEGRIVGLLTYEIRGRRCEVITLDAFRKGRGIGTRLLAAAERRARASGCSEVWLITTNDNLRALRFYQRRGVRIRRVHENALEASRRIKPSIPRVGLHGIMLRDEIELYKPLVPRRRRTR
jgi:ribosomal protein S18 acetylase RimI-like enzyme